MAIPLDLGTIGVGAKRVVKIDCTDELSGSEVLTGTPTVTEVTTTDLTISSKIVNTVTEPIGSRTVAIGKCIRFFVQGQKAGTTYTLTITCATTSSPDAETLAYTGTMACV